MDTPTPKTQKLWLKHVHFSNEEEAEEALADFRDLCAKLERETVSLRNALIFAASWIETGRPIEGLAQQMREAALANT